MTPSDAQWRSVTLSDTQWHLVLRSFCLGVALLHYFKDKTKTGDFDLYSFTEFSPAHCFQQVCNSPPHNSLTWFRVLSESSVVLISRAVAGGSRDIGEIVECDEYATGHNECNTWQYQQNIKQSPPANCVTSIGQQGRINSQQSRGVICEEKPAIKELCTSWLTITSQTLLCPPFTAHMDWKGHRQKIRKSSG